MTNSNNINKTGYVSEYAKTSSGSINYQHYDNRAKDIRSESVWKLLKSFVTDKKSSTNKESEKCHVMTFNKMERNQKQFNSLQKVA